MSHQTTQLVRGLTLADTCALVVGTVIGSGVFLKAAPMAQAVGSPYLVLLAWITAGLLSLAGALTYAELSAMHPEAGGEYAFLRHSYGEWSAFLFGWQRFIVAGSASIASLGVGFAIFLSSIFPLDAVWLRRDIELLGQSFQWQLGAKQVVAVGVIMLMTALNCFTVAFGGKVHLLLTLIKIAGIVFIIIGIFFYSQSASWIHLGSSSKESTTTISLFGTAMLAALWGYDGWNNMVMAGGEVQNPGRNIPRALILGMFAVMAIYCLLNLAYFYALPFEEVLNSNSTKYRDALPVASKASQTFLGDSAGKWINVIFAISAFGALNGSILANARVPFAMARDRLFFSKLGQLHPRTSVPVTCLIAQSIWASILAMSGTFDQLTDCLLFASWIFYGLVASSIFVLRRKAPDRERPYRTIGYPFLPIVFVVVAGWLVMNTLLTKPTESIAGLLLIAAGLPVYIYFRAKRKDGSTDRV